MQFRKLGHTDINVSLLCLGSMTWGEQNTQAEAHAQLDHAINQGINFIDTAEMYPIPTRQETQGRTEEHIGTWLNKHGQREQLIIATKIIPAAEWINYIRGPSTCLDRDNIEQAINASLKRLQTDYIDLYQIHWPERDSNFFGRLNYHHAPDKDGTPIEETLLALAAMVEQGKIRYVGVSNETPWGVAEYLRLARELGLPRIVSIQNPYSLLNRSYEIGLAEFAHREQVGLLAYSPLAFGTLTGKYLDGNKPAGARLTLFGDKYSRYTGPDGVRMTAEYTRLAKEHDLQPAQMALAFVNQRPFLTSNIIGATDLEQLQMNIDSVNVVLPESLLQEIDALHKSQPNPCP
ncbi:MAG: NADP(H)-dependent aldo-keto reductase [Gammaproteobacteria bacterium]